MSKQHVSPLIEEIVLSGPERIFRKLNNELYDLSSNHKTRVIHTHEHQLLCIYSVDCPDDMCHRFYGNCDAWLNVC